MWAVVPVLSLAMPGSTNKQGNLHAMWRTTAGLVKKTQNVD
jgi:hypothetical protein